MNRILIHKISSDLFEKPPVKDITEANYDLWNFKELWWYWGRVGICNLQATPIQGIKDNRIVWDWWLTGEVIRKQCTICD